MRTRWGSCTPSTGAIRLSSALSRFPDWVIDYVIVHELAHLEEPGHTPAFWRLVGALPARRACSRLPHGEERGGDEDDEEGW